MVYKKYIKKGGKIYGPYTYHSKRVDGKVVSEYRGPKKSFSEKLNLNSEKIKKTVLIFLGICFLIFMIYFLVNLEKGSGSISGLAILELIYLEDNQTVLIQDQQGNNIVSLQLLNSLESIGWGGEIIEFRVESYLPYNLNFTLDNIIYFHGNGTTSKIFRDGDVKEKIINGTQEPWKNLSQFELLAGEEKILEVDFSKLDLTLSTEGKNICLGYNNQRITFLMDNLTEGKISVEITSINKTLNQIFNQKMPANLSLTDEEKAILIEEFGIEYRENIKTIRQDVENGRLKIGSQLRDYKIEHSYEYPQDIESSDEYPQYIEILKTQIEADRTKWLKDDIAATLLRKETPSEEKNIV